MKQAELHSLIEKDFTLKQIAKEFGKGPTTIRYWLKKYGLKTKRGRRGKHPKDFETLRKCKCGETDPNKFYGHKKSVCAKCHSKYTLEKGRENRRKSIEYLGGECLECGWKKFGSGFDIHHLNPKEKDVAFASMRSWSWERTKKELDKCILLCKCCHAGHHSGELELVSEIGSLVDRSFWGRDQGSSILSSPTIFFEGDCCATCLNCFGGGAVTIGCICDDSRMSMCYSDIQKARKSAGII